MREIVLGSNDSGKKLENYLKKAFPIGYVRKLFRKNGIRLNDEAVKYELSDEAVAQARVSFRLQYGAPS